MLILSALLVSQPAFAVPIPVGDDASLDVGGLVQTQAVVTEAGAPDGTSAGLDLFVRRARLVVNGTLGKHWAFTFVTDSPNLGKGGDWTGRILVQDALVSAKVARELTVDTGLILLPFGHHGMQSAGTLGTLDYHSAELLYPLNTTQTWRDVGFQLRGLAFKDRLHYRVGVFNGLEGGPAIPDTDQGTTNPKDAPRLAGQLRVNVLGVEDRMYLGGIYFADKPMLSIGASGIVQPDAVGSGADLAPWVGLNGDVFADVPIGKNQELIAQAAVVHYAAGEGAATSGTGGWVELGYRIGLVEPVVSAETFASDAEAADSRAYKFGVNTWIKRHTANVKAEVAITQLGDLAVAPEGITGTL